jgi:hypothetical protein
MKELKETLGITSVLYNSGFSAWYDSFVVG